MPIPVNERSNASVYGRLFAGIAGSIPAGGMDVSLLWVLRAVRQRFLRRADLSIRGVLPIVVCQCVWSRNLKEWDGPDPRWAVVPENK